MRVALEQERSDGFQRDLSLLLDGRRSILYCEIVVSVYGALGHNPSNPRSTTFEHLQRNPVILQGAFRCDEEQIARILNALDPRPPNSFIKCGNAQAHRFSLEEAERLADETPSCELLSEMAQHASGPLSTLNDAACGMHNDLIGRIPAVQDIASLPNPQGRNSHITEEVLQCLQTCLYAEYV